MADVTLTLTDDSGGSITFEGVELPQSVAWGSQQHLATQDFVGGGRQLQALGGNPAPLSWDGLFFGREASTRARYLDTLAVQGTTVVVTWAEFSYIGVIRQFAAQYLAPWHVRYQISIEIDENATGAQPTAPKESLLTLINQGVQQASCLGNLIGDATLSNLLGAVSSAAQTLNSVVEQATAPIAMAASCVQQATQTAQSALQAMLQPLSNAQQRVTTLIGNAETAVNLVQNVTQGVFSGATPQAIQSLATANVGYGPVQPLNQLQATLGVLSKNVQAGLPGSSAKLIAVNGGNLQAVAAKMYGDATLWPAIAQVNGLSDPMLPGQPMTLQIPSASVAAGGL